ncbi:efflux RND transporter permease subunit [Eubacterium oxidoreducens]|uniref:SSD domain-containing protein n=1 Tax=Eubacterium oxidoreducens TaxID=1732 RepID=A0A1G6CDB3_EUBOX|nr:MMPL family transporter [Eubacterium oxidoreducens]SDB30791.1 hypothetical protein SAMN02910417_02279 [Eubacterium oxidoreducens]
MRLAKGVVKFRVPILIIVLVLMIPSVLGMVKTRINYDMLTYLPEDMETVIGQDELLEDFGKGAFSFILLEDMPNEDVKELKSKIENVNHVESVIWYDSFVEGDIPMEILPDEVYDAFNNEDTTMMAVFFDTSTSADETITAIKEIRSMTTKQAYITGMSAMVTDLKDLCEREEPIYVGIAVVLAAVAMMVLLDGFLVPIIFLVSIALMILLNMGTNIFLGEISYITKALSAVLQLAVTMDYSIFLWHSYNEKRLDYSDKNEAMKHAISETMTAVAGSSITTIAGFIALCFMSYTLGADLGIVMAKGVVLGVIGSVTVLPSLILVFDKPLQKTRHKSLLADMNGLAGKVVKLFPIFVVIFAVLIPPSYYGYKQTNEELYYDMISSLPEDLEVVIANSKLSEDFDVASTHMVLVDADLEDSEVRDMMDEMEAVDGVDYVLGLESVIGSQVPEAIIPDEMKELLQSDEWELLLINSEYSAASDEVNAQIDSLNTILKRYDSNGLLIGEAPCMKDMIDTTAHDFQVVNTVSIIAIFIIILLVERSLILPVILIAVIELAIFINLGLPHFMGQSLPFIAPVCISTIQLGATVDYAILLTTKYKAETLAGKDRNQAVKDALSSTIPSILVSGFGLFAATFGVAVYSEIDIISSLCMLLARGAIVSMLCVIFLLPALLTLCDKLIKMTTLGMRPGKERTHKGVFHHEQTI